MDSNQPYPVPAAERFTVGQGNMDFIDALDLDDLAREVIRKHPILDWLRERELLFLWKRVGGKSHGRARVAHCVKPTGLLRRATGADFVIWLAADTLREAMYTVGQVEALLYHELRHCDQDENGKLSIAGHDFEGFASELAEYGAWNPDLENIVDIARQLPLPLTFADRRQEPLPVKT